MDHAKRIDRAIVTTTIHGGSPAVDAFSRIPGWRLIVAGDAKTPPLETAGAYDYLSLDAQFGFARSAGLDLPRLLPENHGARRNAAYLAAIARGATTIYETDDHTAPASDWSPVPDPKAPFVCARTLTPADSASVCNVYAHFAAGTGCWPRGYPLERVADHARPHAVMDGAHEIGVWQGMADDAPDVDAIWRLTRAEPVRFQRREPVSLGPGVWSPCNSRNTTWRSDAFRWLYLPATTSMRTSDIIRGYIAQRCLWADGLRLGVLGPTVRRERAGSEPLLDLEAETLLYTRAGELIETLTDLPVESWQPDERLVAIYRTLVSLRFMHRKELDLVEAWSADIERLLAAQPARRVAAA
jgi:hypothetical protein